MPAVLFAEVALLAPLRPMSRPVEDLFLALGFATGPLWGYVIPRARDYMVARWTWILPVAFLLYCVATDWRLFGLRQAAAQYFYPAEGDEGLGLLISVPVASAVLYSIGAAVGCARARRRARRETERIDATGDGTL